MVKLVDRHELTLARQEYLLNTLEYLLDTPIGCVAFVLPQREYLLGTELEEAMKRAAP